MYERTLVVSGFSKSHAMPGLRVGYLAAPKYFVDACTKLQGQFTSCASSIGQAAALEAMALEMENVEQGIDRIAGALAVLDEKRKYVVKRLEQIPNIRFAYPSSAFYIFVDMTYYFEQHNFCAPDALNDRLASADEFCEYVLRAFCVALVPGSSFGVDFSLRISYASSMETLEHASDGLEKAIQSLILK
jgi:aspartate/methionine/tyrosine aminotransferase